MPKKNPTAQTNENVTVAKIGAMQAIVVALISAIATAIPVYFAARQHGKLG